MAAHRLALPITPLILLLAHQPLEFFLKNTLQKHNFRGRLTNAVILFGLTLYMLVPFLYTTNIYNRVMASQMDMSIYRWAKEMQSIVDGQYVDYSAVALCKQL